MSEKSVTVIGVRRSGAIEDVSAKPSQEDSAIILDQVYRELAGR